MNEERIMTLHPKGKKGVNITKKKYDIIKGFILNTIKENQEIKFDDLRDIALKELSASFEGRIVWYIVTVKLDLEARGFIERVPKTSPHRLRIKD